MSLRLFWYLIILLPLATFGQSLDMQKMHYLKNIPLHQEVESGGQYIDPPVDIEGHPYIYSGSFVEGSVTMNGLTYHDVALAYNIWEDQLITFHTEHKWKILLNASKIESFAINQNSPKRIVKWDANAGFVHHRNGFYEEVATGQARLLAKHVKFTKPKNEAGKYSSTFVYKEYYFIELGKEIHQITSRKQIMNLLGLDNSQLKSAGQELKLSFKNTRKAYLTFLVEKYNNRQG